MENDMLSSLLSDPESLQNAMKTVSDLLGGQPSAQAEPQNAYDPASEMMQKPFVAEEVSGQFDRALRLVSMARMARAALGQVNLSADDTTPRAL